MALSRSVPSRAIPYTSGYASIADCSTEESVSLNTWGQGRGAHLPDVLSLSGLHFESWCLILPAPLQQLLFVTYQNVYQVTHSEQRATGNSEAA